MSWTPRITVPGLNFGDDGALYGTETAVTVGASARTTLPAGYMVIRTDAHTSVEYTPDGGSTYVELVAASGGGSLLSDGNNFSVLGDTTGGTAHYSQVS